jgi:predicted nucleic-acid-binding Zn-ribbon protein
MSKWLKIKCQQCGEWKNIKILPGSKQKKMCNRCLHPELYDKDGILI